MDALKKKETISAIGTIMTLAILLAMATGSIASLVLGNILVFQKISIVCWVAGLTTILAGMAIDGVVYNKRGGPPIHRDQQPLKFWLIVGSGIVVMIVVVACFFLL